ncbi:MAG TPA: lysophospholipid acyltransferase family protein [Candidatus Binatia bacterium]
MSATFSDKEFVSWRGEFFIVEAMRTIAALLAAGRLNTRTEGVENVPTLGPALIVARHYHHLYDGLALFAALPRSFHIVVAIDWVKNRRMRWFMETINRIARWPTLIRADALARSGYATRLFSPGDVARYRRSALRDATELLVQNRIVVIFPEGYPNIDPTYTPKKHLNEFLPFKPGFLEILGAAQKRTHRAIPIIPTGLYYHPPEYRAAVVRFGEPVWRDGFSDPLQLLRFLERRVKELSIE